MSRTSVVLSVVIGTCLSLTVAASGGDCPKQWLYGPDQGVPGVDGEVKAATAWDPDGGGPEPELLVVGGEFSVAGTIAANNIAAWDGSSWQTLGSGMNERVHALAVYNGELIAGGRFTTAGGAERSHIARWDGSSWQPLGEGVDGSVLAFAVFNDELIAGGWFTTAGGGECNDIARWDG